MARQKALMQEARGFGRFWRCLLGQEINFADCLTISTDQKYLLLNI
ncbi:MAG: hypothetical protein HEQ13_05125 [Dolichospermum sp. DEX189]|nr:hypothetical protein [Dolichospermum sp. DEX189]